MKRIFIFITVFLVLMSNISLLTVSADSDLSFLHLDDPPDVPSMGLPDGSRYNGAEDEIKDDIDDMQDDYDAVTVLSSSPDDSTETDEYEPYLDAPDVDEPEPSVSSDTDSDVDSENPIDPDSVSVFSSRSRAASTRSLDKGDIVDGEPLLSSQLKQFIDMFSFYYSLEYPLTLEDPYDFYSMDLTLFLQQYDDESFSFTAVFYPSMSEDCKIYHGNNYLHYSGTCEIIRAQGRWLPYEDDPDLLGTRRIKFQNCYALTELSSSKITSFSTAPSLDYLAYSSVSLYDLDGNLLYEGNVVNGSVYVSDNAAFYSVSLSSAASQGASFRACITGVDFPSIEEEFLDVGSVSPGESREGSFPLNEIKEYCHGKNVDMTNCGIWLEVMYKGEEFEYTLQFDTETVNGIEGDGLFSDYKEYYDVPDIDDYITDFPEFPGFDIAHPWESLSNILSWIGDCVIIVGKNLWGLLRWLKDTFVVLIKNLGVFLYNLMVELRSLLKYLFVPSKKVLSKSVKENFPIFSTLSDRFKNSSFSFSGFTINLLGNSYSFNPVDYFSSDVLSVIRNFSNIIILAFGCWSIYSKTMSFIDFYKSR